MKLITINTVRESDLIISSAVYIRMKDNLKKALFSDIMHKACLSVMFDEHRTQEAALRILGIQGTISIFNNDYEFDLSDSNSMRELVVQISKSISNRLRKDMILTKDNKNTVCYYNTFRSGNSVVNIL